MCAGDSRPLASGSVLLFPGALAFRTRTASRGWESLVHAQAGAGLSTRHLGNRGVKVAARAAQRGADGGGETPARGRGVALRASCRGRLLVGKICVDHICSFLHFFLTCDHRRVCSRPVLSPPGLLSSSWRSSVHVSPLSLAVPGTKMGLHATPGPSALVQAGRNSFRYPSSVVMHEP